MSDLRLEDLLSSLDPHDGMEACSYCDALRLLTRPVTRTEVLEALGAERKWVCWGNDPEDSCDRHSYFEEGSNEHASCGLHWVVPDS